MADFNEIIQEINTNLPDNNTQSITAAKLRTTLVDLTNAIDTQQDDFETTVNNTLGEYETQVENLLTNICVDNLNSTETSKALSANQGRVIKNILFGTIDETLSDELTISGIGSYGFKNASTGSTASSVVYYYSYGNSRASRITVASFGTQEIGKYRYLRVQANATYYAYITFLKKDIPTTNNMTYQNLVDGDYLCTSVHYDAEHVAISVTNNTTVDLEIPRDCKSIVFAGRLSSDGSSTSTSARIPVSVKAYGIIQPDNIYYQSPIPNGYVNSEMIGEGQVNTNDIADGAINSDKLEDNLIEKNLTGESNEYFSFNLIDFDNLSNGYINANGTVSSVSSGYKATDFIKLNGKKVYWGNGFISSYGGTSGIGGCVYDANKTKIRNFGCGSSGSYDPVTQDEGAVYIRLSYTGNYTLRYVVYANEDGSNPMESQSSIVTGNIDDYFDQIINSANINLSFPKENIPELIPAYSSVGQNGFSKTFDSIGSYGYITADEYPSYVKCNHTISFKGYLADTLSGTDTIKFGIARNSINGKILSITPTQAIIQRYDSSSGYVNNVSFTHNLTIKDFIMCEITFTWYGGKMRIISSGGSFVQEWQNSQYSYTGNAQVNYGRAFVEPTIALNNVKLTQSSDRFMKPVWVCGDSYTSMSTARWTYQMINTYGIDGFLIDGFAGAQSADIYPDLVQMLKYGTPKYLYWCLGMNDNSVLWKNYSQLVEKLCRERGITLIYQTIPWPTSGYAEKSKIDSFIKNSGYRYVDAYKAVCKDDNGTWYDGMLDDGVHPTTLGAKAIAGQVLVDFPEIANYK